nr:HepT-like ribonuclease domain-containing protein [uncultured Victivallis sp.]
MLKAIEKIFGATDCTREDFMASPLRQDAVAYNFLILGEAAGRIVPGNAVEARDRHAECPDPRLCSDQLPTGMDFGPTGPAGPVRTTAENPIRRMRVLQKIFAVSAGF